MLCIHIFQLTVPKYQKREREQNCQGNVKKLIRTEGIRQKINFLFTLITIKKISISKNLH
jgi:hypothetical protein